MNFIRTQISALNKLSLKDITRSIDDELIRLSPPFWIGTVVPNSTGLNQDQMS